MPADKQTTTIDNRDIWKPGEKVGSGTPLEDLGLKAVSREEVKGPSLSATPEINQLGRALFLNAGSAIEHCAFDNILNLDQEDYVPSKENAGPTDKDMDKEQDGDSVNVLYAPLKDHRSLRVLIVQPGAGNDPLRTNLSPAHLDDEETHFEAVSYCWGSPTDKDGLQCNGQTVQVPNNLLDALRHIRSPSKRRVVWADAVCINQEDVEERGQQVAIMRHIFKRAHRVLVWLGRDDESIASSAFELTCEIVKQWKPEGDLYAWEPYQDLTNPTAELRPALSTVSLEAWEHLRTMLSLSWFTRVWIVQEVNVNIAKNIIVMWGDHHIAWPLIGLCATWIVTEGWYALGDRTIEQAYNAFLKYAILPLSGPNTLTQFRELDLSLVLGAMRGSFSATDARDFIYGLLGLRFAGNDAQNDKLILQPDYTLSLEEVFVKSAKTILKHDRHLRMLTAVQHGPEVDETWPSWVPRWDQSYNLSMGFGDENGFYANAGELFNVENADDELYGPDGLSLRVTGLRSQTIVEVSEELSWDNLNPEGLGDFFPGFASVVNALSNPGNDYRFLMAHNSEQYTLFGFTDKRALEDQPLWYEGSPRVSFTVKPGKYHQRLFCESQMVDHLCAFALYWRERGTWRNVKDYNGLKTRFMNNGAGSYELERFCSTFNVLPRRRLFRCADGSWGLGPAACRPGDSVVVLFGATVPFVLRPRSEEVGEATSSDPSPSSPSKQPTWTLVGECFKEGIMQGEAVIESGMLEDKYTRYNNGSIQLKPPPDFTWKDDGTWDWRLERKVGEFGVEEFILR